jgi:hypothetical protein
VSHAGAAAVAGLLAMFMTSSADAQKAGAKAGARPSCELHVSNRTPFRVLVHVDGVYRGWVNAQREFTFKGMPTGAVVLYGTTQYGEYSWGPKPLKCEGSGNWELAF